MLIDHDNFEEFRDPVTYDLECDAFDDDFPFMEQWAKSIDAPLLDLACGTGRMALHLTALGHQITGVDVVPEMIGRAREKADERSLSVEWVVADARSFHLNQQFRGIYMLMNAFQFLLTRADHEAMFACVREHLQPDGYFLFETRNPSLRNLSEGRHPEGDRFPTDDGGEMVNTPQQYYDPLTQLQHYTSTYEWFQNGVKQRTKILRTALRYVFPQEMEALLHYNGFKLHAWYGNWQQGPLTATSTEMIVVCQKRA